jgi:hypothetical protein
MSKYQPRIRLLAADSHRNGIGGAPFRVVIFKDIDPESEVKGETFLGIQFYDAICPVCHGSGKVRTNVKCARCKGKGEISDGITERTAVLRVSDISDGNVYMHPEYDKNGDVIPGTGGAAWRGADYYGPQIRDAFARYEKRSWRNKNKGWDKQRAAREAAKEATA